jgi:polyketide biosynthesis acyl carrier protein
MTNDRERAFSTIRRAIAEVLPDLEVDKVTTEDRLHDLGADSVQRAEVLILAMEELGIKIPMVAFAESKNIGGVVDVLVRPVEAR